MTIANKIISYPSIKAYSRTEKSAMHNTTFTDDMLPYRNGKDYYVSATMLNTFLLVHTLKINLIQFVILF